ncbi:ketopantoate reductase family protein [Desulfosporosinus burensis]
MRTAIMGAGSLGTIAGALITKNGGDIILIDANKEHVKALNEKGATITGTMELTIPVKAITPDEMTGIYDVVLYLVKQTYNEVALKQLLPHLGPDSVVCTLQNGVPEDAVAEIIGKERTLSGTVGWGATFVGPGVSMLTSDPNKMSYDIGELDGSIRERTKKVAELLNLSAETIIVPNLAGIRWTKLIVNATMSGMSAALGCTYGDILDNEKALACAVHIGNETLEIVKARGIKLEPLQGHDLSVLAFQYKQERAAKYPYYKAVFSPHRLLKASMLQDLEKGLKTEIDAIDGVISDWGKKLGIATPISDKVVEIVKGIEAGKYTYKLENLDMFELPEIPEA